MRTQKSSMSIHGVGLGAAVSVHNVVGMELERTEGVGRMMETVGGT